MRHSLPRITNAALAVSALMLALTPAFPAADGGAATPAIASIAVSGSVVAITVANPTPVPVLATVTVRVSTAGGATLETVPVAIGPAGTATVAVEASAPVTGALPLGVVLDDGVPF